MKLVKKQIQYETADVVWEYLENEISSYVRSKGWNIYAQLQERAYHQVTSPIRKQVRKGE